MTTGLASAAFVVGAAAARRPGISAAEARCFSTVNALPRWPFPAVWLVMQLGSLSGPMIVGALAARAGRPALGRRVAVTGAATWAGAKLVKHTVRRGRPATLSAARILGREQSGLGYPSGHAAVAAAIATVVAPTLPAGWRRWVWGAALSVGPARMYVGAHLPLDVAGGVAFGIAAASAVDR